MIQQLVYFYLKEIPGPRNFILFMSVIASFAYGGLLSIINDTIKSQGIDTFGLLHIILFLICFSIYLSGSYFSMYKTTEVVGYMMHNMRLTLSKKLIESSLYEVEKYKRGEIYAHLTVDIDQLSATALRLVKTFQSSIVLFFCALYIGWLSPPSVLFLLCGLIVGVFAYLVQHKKAKDNQIIARDGEAKFFEAIADELNGLKELKLRQAKSTDLSSFLELLSDKFRFHYTKAELHFYISFLTSQVALFFILGLVIFMPSDWLVSDSATHFQLLATLLFAMKPIEEVVSSISSITRGAVALSKIKSLEQTLDKAKEAAPQPLHNNIKAPNKITLQNITMRYQSLHHSEVFNFGPVNLDIEAGETLFIVGGNGSGKTTLLKLLSGLYPADQGQIIVDGKVLSPGQIPSYRQFFSAIFTDFHLFNRLYGLTDPDQGRINELLKDFDLSDKTHFTEGAFSTTALSTGQKKRLALCALMMEDHPVIIFDEFAADQDPKFRQYFYYTLLPYLKSLGKTIIAVTHDDRFFDCCDRIIKLEYGGVVSNEIHDRKNDDREKKRVIDI